MNNIKEIKEIMEQLSGQSESMHKFNLNLNEELFERKGTDCKIYKFIEYQDDTSDPLYYVESGLQAYQEESIKSKCFLSEAVVKKTNMGIFSTSRLLINLPISAVKLLGRPVIEQDIIEIESKKYIVEDQQPGNGSDYKYTLIVSEVVAVDLSLRTT